MAMETTYARSKHLLLSSARYRTPAGEPVQLGYATRTGTIFEAGLDTARALEAGEISALPPAERDYLAGIEALVPAGEDELSVVTGRLRGWTNGPGIRRVAILPTAYCNMMCAYCGQEHRKSRVKEERARKLTERVKRSMSDPATTKLSVMWFGGEPLMGLRIIREMSAEFITESRRTGMHYMADVTTNGSLLTERTLALLYGECQIRFLEITLDGPAEVHNKRRLKRNGTGSFDHIVDLISRVVRDGDYPGLGFGIRVNIDNQNEDSVPDLIGDLAGHGIGGDRVKLSLAPVHSWGNDVSARALARREFARQEAEWIRLATALGISAGFLASRARTATCLATMPTAEVIDPDGNIYSCSEHPLVPIDRDRGRVGTVDSLGPDEQRGPGLYAGWYDEVSAGRWPCSRCPFLPVCGGGCPKLWHEGSMACPSYKFNWADRLDLRALEAGLVPYE